MENFQGWAAEEKFEVEEDFQVHTVKEEINVKTRYFESKNCSSVQT